MNEMGKWVIRRSEEKRGEARRGDIRERRETASGEKKTKKEE